MAVTKKLVVAVEGTAALGPHWRTIVSGYLEKVIRIAAKIAPSACLVQRSGWTKNMNMFLEWLSAINFSGGGFSDAAIAEGLAEVLMMLPSVHGSQNHERHCILVAASNPYPLPTPVYIGMHSESPLSDAETVAKYFKQCLVSLSVICPRQLSKLNAIYNAAKGNTSKIDPTIGILKNPNYLVLISESFMEARAALSQPEITNLPSSQTPIEVDVTPVSGPPQASVSPGFFELQPKIPPATETSTVSVMESAETISPLSTSQEMTSSRNDNVENSKSVVSAIAKITKKPSSGNPNISKITNRGMTSSLPLKSAGQAESATLPETSNDNVATNVGPPQQRYVKLWEGNLTVERQGQDVFITKLQAYRNTKASDSLAKDWPSTMQINRLVPEDEIKNNKKPSGKVDYLVFIAMNEHSTFLGRMKEKKLSLVITLPSQTLLLSVSADKASRLVGMLLPQKIKPPSEFESSVEKKQSKITQQFHQQMADTKQLVLVVEGTAAMGPYWRTIVSDYLEKIIRSFCEDSVNNSWLPDSPIVELALVNYNFHGAYSCAYISFSIIININEIDMRVYLIHQVSYAFVMQLACPGRNFCHAGIAEGLAEALMMFHSVPGSQNNQRHCILVAASNPYPLPTPVYKPPDYIGMQTGSVLSDVVTVAQSFPRCLVSLSVISPWELRRFKAIFNAANENAAAIGNLKNPNHLVLISESFMEARAALTQPEIIEVPSPDSSMASAQDSSASPPFQEMTSSDGTNDAY
ncbi:hypothetical protein L2E82_43198 [Cichorium intybus]|uniref:Uncharacterized protein n=1 Tax=Cichorium intybus TaxID=13427 RepID=A0ACB8ZNR6_CICIN|nr:hypothetical protein L2E82_43198 [Cichorium intybus]